MRVQNIISEILPGLGNTIYPSAFLSQELGIKKGDVYNIKDLEKNITYNPNGTDVSALYQDNGYLFSRIIPIETRIYNDSIDIEMRVREGKVAVINKVTIAVEYPHKRPCCAS